MRARWFLSSPAFIRIGCSPCGCPVPSGDQLQTTGTQREVVLLLPTWTVLVWLLGPGLGFRDQGHPSTISHVGLGLGGLSSKMLCWPWEGTGAWLGPRTCRVPRALGAGPETRELSRSWAAGRASQWGGVGLGRANGESEGLHQGRLGCASPHRRQTQV